MNSEISIPKGTRDFGPDILAKRRFLFETIRRRFELSGFMPLETPAMEKTEILSGKYGDEGEQLMFKILNSGDFAKNLKGGDLQANSKKIASEISEKALRYDLTVPLARYVVMHRHALTYPFKRYQIQPVWRADRPQKGRYREFWQCDADIIGSDSLLNETELLLMLDRTFTDLRLHTVIKLNHRKILQGIVEYCGCADRLTDVTVTIDKLEKINAEGVKKELLGKGFSEETILYLFSCLFIDEEEFEKKNISKIQQLKEKFISKKIESGLKGLEEIEKITTRLATLDVLNRMEFTPSLARGLSYYTGCILEVQACDMKAGSLAAGGRYDNLTGIFGMPGVSGVGISFGIDRIYDVLEELGLFPSDKTSYVDVVFCRFGEDSVTYCLPTAEKLRRMGIRCEIYPDEAKLKKQFAYADAKGAAFVAVAGEEEMKTGTLMLKDMQKGSQEALSEDELIQKIITLKK